MKTIILTDSCCDLPKSYLDGNNIDTLGINVNFEGKEYQDDFNRTIKYKDFYEAIRKGSLPFTSQISVQPFLDIFRKHAAQGEAVIYLGFSSALSGCVNSSNIAKDTVLEEYKDADITIIDTKSASLGEGLIIYYAAEMLKSGNTKEEIVNWVESNKLKVNHWFTVDDLFHLKRGGRLSSTAAAIGTLLNIKPILHVDDEGRLIPVSKVSGRKKSIRTLAEMLKSKIVNPKEQVIFISHGDCPEDAELLKKEILKDVKVKDIIINYIGPGIGAHSGPGTLAVFFRGDNR